MKVLDLAQFIEPTMKLITVDKRVIRLKKPTQAIVIEALALKKICESANEEEIKVALNRVIMSILNNNDESKVFTVDEMEVLLSIEERVALLNEYEKFIEELQNSPFYQSLLSQIQQNQKG